ncbi:response regulator transcription factor [bacterium]|nr:response regulator transcription factor [bacterium]
MPRILIIEDEPDMRRGLQDNLEFENYEVVTTANGVEGLRLAQKEDFDLILLDLMLPGMDGIDVCRHLKDGGSLTPIIMLTARGSEADKIEGLEIGADDYITKPFSLRELLARIKVILRRTQLEPRESIHTFEFAGVLIDFDHMTVTKNGEELEFSPREIEIMKLLVESEGKIVTREQFLKQVWGYDNVPATRTVDNHIAKLRQKIEDEPDSPQHIITAHRQGYRFIP